MQVVNGSEKNESLVIAPATTGVVFDIDYLSFKRN